MTSDTPETSETPPSATETPVEQPTAETPPVVQSETEAAQSAPSEPAIPLRIVDSRPVVTPIVDAPRQYASADEILAIDDTVVRDEYIPEWKTWVTLRSMTAEEAIRFQEESTGPAEKNSDILLILMCAVRRDPADPDSVEKLAPLFERNKLVALKKKNLNAIKRLQRVSLELNTLGAEAKK